MYLIARDASFGSNAWGYQRRALNGPARLRLGFESKPRRAGCIPDRIAFFIPHQLRPDYMGALGNQVAKNSRVDALAAHAAPFACFCRTSSPLWRPRTGGQQANFPLAT